MRKVRKYEIKREKTEEGRKERREGFKIIIK